MNDAEAYKLFLARIMPDPAVVAEHVDLYAIFRAQAMPKEIDHSPSIYSMLANMDGTQTILYGRRKPGSVRRKIAKIEFVGEYADRLEQTREKIFLGHLIDQLNNFKNKKNHKIREPAPNSRFRIIDEITETNSDRYNYGYMIGRDVTGTYQPHIKIMFREVNCHDYRDSLHAAARDLGHTMDGIATRASRPPSQSGPTP